MVTESRNGMYQSSTISVVGQYGTFVHRRVAHAGAFAEPVTRTEGHAAAAQIEEERESGLRPAASGAETARARRSRRRGAFAGKSS